MGDAEMRRMVADPRAPAFESSAFTSPPALNEATVALLALSRGLPGLAPLPRCLPPMQARMRLAPHFS
jgi:hypothetical protein